MLFFISLWTGAGSGLGRMLSEKLALRHGAKVVCVDVNAEGNAETVNNINREKVRMRMRMTIVERRGKREDDHRVGREIYQLLFVSRN